MRPAIHTPVPARKLRKPAPQSGPRRELTEATPSVAKENAKDATKRAVPVSSDERKAAELFG